MKLCCGMVFQVNVYCLVLKFELFHICGFKLSCIIFVFKLYTVYTQIIKKKYLFIIINTYLNIYC